MYAERAVKNESTFFTALFLWEILEGLAIVSSFKGISRSSKPEIPDSDDTMRCKVSSFWAFRGCRDLKSQILMILCVAMYHHLWYFRGYNSPNPRF